MRTLGALLTAVLCIGILSSFDSIDKESLVIKTKPNVNFMKTITPFEFGESVLYKVQVQISNASTIKGIAKYEDLIPVGFTVSGMYTDFGQATFDSEKAEVTFLSLSQRDKVTITYYLQGDLNMAPKSESKFSFLEGEDLVKQSIIIE